LAVSLCVVVHAGGTRIKRTLGRGPSTSIFPWRSYVPASTRTHTQRARVQYIYVCRQCPCRNQLDKGLSPLWPPFCVRLAVSCARARARESSAPPAVRAPARAHTQPIPLFRTIPRGPGRPRGQWRRDPERVFVLTAKINNSPPGVRSRRDPGISDAGGRRNGRTNASRTATRRVVAHETRRKSTRHSFLCVRGRRCGQCENYLRRPAYDLCTYTGNNWCRVRLLFLQRASSVRFEIRINNSRQCSWRCEHSRRLQPKQFSNPKWFVLFSTFVYIYFFFFPFDSSKPFEFARVSQTDLLTCSMYRSTTCCVVSTDFHKVLYN